jgi:acetolactate synthase-1/2/3 large subunit
VKYADVIVVIECDEPWHPEFTNLSHDPKIIRFGNDLGGHPALAIRRITSTLDKMRPDRERIKGRLAAYASEHRRVLQQAQTRAIAEAARPKITLQFLSYCLGEAIDDRVTIWNDSKLDPQLVPRRLADSWFSCSVRGWVFGAALGGQLANRDQTMVVVMSDASYMSSEPLAAHTVANNKKLPIVTIVLNEDPAVKCDAVAEACGAKSMRVENPRELAASLRAALQVARGDKQQVLLNACIVP